MIRLSRIPLSLFLGTVLLLSGFVAEPGLAGDHTECAECVKKRPGLLERRPCGPDSIKGPLRYLFFQGCAGADFREACRRHDACYDTVGSCRACCDREFFEALLAECGNSRFPAHARFRARISYWAVRMAGQSAWDAAQILAIRKAGGDVDPSPSAAPPQEAFTGIFAGFADLPLFSKSR
ncbi:MAG: hypothetical protein GXX91_04060 [Verrucomicrobiaceae bacterium]|nr:hypothetical protein [Verrucomicrobiaceae bacterium]